MNEQKIRERAHAIWEREGRPQGREQEHWERAERELRAEGSLVDTASDASGEAPRADASAAEDSAGDRANAGNPASSQGEPGPGASPAPGIAGNGTTTGTGSGAGKSRKGGAGKAGASPGSASKERARRGVVKPDA